MRKRSGQVHSRESSATLQLTVSLLYHNYYYYIDAGIRLGYNTSKEKDGRNQNE